ncbi:MAG: LytR/AlgR family response regulator transcription factor [Nocardioidaceae bacterium]
MNALTVLAVDDERPALDELEYLLRQDGRVGDVSTAESAAEALRLLQAGSFGAVFLDIAMPGLSGLELAKVLAQFREAPAVVFVTAHDEHAVDAFEMNAVDYLLKPVRPDRLREAVRRIVDGSTALPDLDTVAVELGGVTRFVPRSEIAYVVAHGDYARLHTRTESHLVRAALTSLEEEWRGAGFLRIHRSMLVSLAHVDQVRVESGRWSVLVAGTELAVSRRHTRELRDVLVRRARPGATP